MSLIDDARRLAETDPQPVNPRARCHWCDQFTLTEPHAPDCPWLAMPKIMAALEAAQNVVNEGPPESPHSYGGYECGYCLGGVMGQTDSTYHHDPGCVWQALAAALKGQEVVP